MGDFSEKEKKLVYEALMADLANQLRLIKKLSSGTPGTKPSEYGWFVFTAGGPGGTHYLKLHRKKAKHDLLRRTVIRREVIVDGKGMDDLFYVEGDGSGKRKPRDLKVMRKPIVEGQVRVEGDVALFRGNITADPKFQKAVLMIYRAAHPSLRKVSYIDAKAGALPAVREDWTGGTILIADNDDTNDLAVDGQMGTTSSDDVDAKLVELFGEGVEPDDKEWKALVESAKPLNIVELDILHSVDDDDLEEEADDIDDLGTMDLDEALATVTSMFDDLLEDAKAEIETTYDNADDVSAKGSATKEELVESFAGALELLSDDVQDFVEYAVENPTTLDRTFQSIANLLNSNALLTLLHTDFVVGCRDELTSQLDELKSEIAEM